MTALEPPTTPYWLAALTDSPAGTTYGEDAPSARRGLLADTADLLTAVADLLRNAALAVVAVMALIVLVRLGGGWLYHQAAPMLLGGAR